MKFSYTTNIKDVIDDLNMAASVTRPAVVRALNKTIAQVKVRGAREVRDAGYKLKISDIKNAIKVNRANSGQLRASAVASGRPIPLIKYNARPVSSGVSVDVLNGRKVIAHAFITNTTNGTKQVFVREPNAKHKKIVKNGKAQWTALPLRKLYGPSIPDGMANKAVADAIVGLMTERFPIILEHEHEWLSKRLTKLKPVPSD
jgi:hypothetical protein